MRCTQAAWSSPFANNAFSDWGRKLSCAQASLAPKWPLLDAWSCMAAAQTGDVPQANHQMSQADHHEP